ncbi:MAG: hypothetical protein ACRDQ4_25015 [Pseudonocardiaceae bacterium]
MGVARGALALGYLGKRRPQVDRAGFGDHPAPELIPGPRCAVPSQVEPRGRVRPRSGQRGWLAEDTSADGFGYPDRAVPKRQVVRRPGG